MKKKPHHSNAEYIILLASNDSAALKAISERVESSGYTVVTADCAEAVYEYLFDEHFKPDAVLIDLQSPESSNLGICKNIQKKRPLYSIPLIISTADETLDYLKKAREAGAIDIIGKPIDGHYLEYKISSIIYREHPFSSIIRQNKHLELTKSIARIAEWSWDIKNKSLFWSNDLYQLIGFSDEIRVAHHTVLLDYVHEDDKLRVKDHIHRLFTLTDSKSDIKYRIVNNSSSTIYVHEYAQILTEENSDQPSTIIGAIQNVREQHIAEDKGRHAGHHDTLTALPNRNSFEDNLKQAIIKASRYGQKLAVMLLDLDDFQDINISLGKEVGDGVLRTVSHRLHQCLRDSDMIGRNTKEDIKSLSETIARWGGDEFIILLENNIDPFSIPRLCQRIISSINKPINLESNNLSIGISIGISLYPLDAMDPIGLMKYADVAMYTAKSSGKNKFQFYDSEVNQSAYRRFKIETELRSQNYDEKAYLVYQPNVDLKTNQIVSCEALIRWRHSELGLLMPNEFISIAEDCGTSSSMGEWVIYEACRQIKLWHANNHKIDISVNLSPRQFANREVVNTVKYALDEAKLSAHHLIVEITENMLMKDFDHAAEVICALKDLGVKVHIDDFGTGYSSLKYLSIFPIDALKIDRSFIQNLPDNNKDVTIIKTIIALAKNLNISVIAEGTETDLQVEFLQENDCDFAQGFYFAQPMGTVRINDFMANYRRSIEEQQGPDKHT